ncbi:10321_t:CDS:2 [Entrophospora sp. SA101]|nr:10321_t:CDS:2 [Entrophospora sp. SA101]
MKDAGINFSVKYLDSDDDIPRDYEKTSEFRYIKKLVKKLNNSKFLDYFDKCQECGKLFHEPWGGGYCIKHIVNKPLTNFTLRFSLSRSTSKSCSK